MSRPRILCNFSRTKVDQLLIFVFCLLFLVLLEIPALSSILLVGTLLLSTSVGVVLTRQVSADSDLVLPMMIGLAALFGFSQLLILIGLNSMIAHSLAICGLAISAATQTHRSNVAREPCNRFHTLKWSVVVTALVLASFQSWLIPFALSLLLADRLLNQPRINRSFRLFGLISVAVGWFWSTNIRPVNWWYFFQGNDSQFFESVSWSVSEWGVLEHPGLSGSSILNYHWLSYGLLGSLSHVAILPPWNALMKFGPPFIMFLFAATLLKQIKTRNARHSTFHFLFVFVVVRSVSSLRFESLGFSLILAITFLEVSSKTIRNPRRYLHILLFSFLSIMLVFSKVSTAAIVLAVLICQLLVMKLQGTDRTYPLLPTACLVCVSTLLYLSVFRTTSSSAFKIPTQISWQASLIEVRGLIENLSLTIQLLIILGLWRLVLKTKQVFVAQFVATSIVLFLGLCAQLLFPSAKSSYFGAPTLTILVCLLVARALEIDPWAGQMSRRIKLNVQVVALIGWLVGLYQDRLFVWLATFTRIPLMLGEFGWSIVQGSGFAIACWLIAASVARAHRRKASLVLIGVVSVFAGHLVGVGQRSFQNILSYGSTNYTNWSDNAAPFGTTDLQVVGAYIRGHTERDSLMASNNFCCYGRDWLLPILSDPAKYAMSHDGEVKWGGANYLLPAETRRRFLVQGIRFQTGHGVASSAQLERLQLSVDFATAPSSDIVSALRSLGVEYFVVNLDLTPRRSWSQFADTVFRSGSFLILRLRAYEQ